MNETITPIEHVALPRWRLARHAVVSASPEEDAMLCLERWAERSGLLAFPGYAPRRIGWDFPCVSDRQRDDFGMHGYVGAYLLPEEFVPACEGAEIAYLEADSYARLTITDPMSSPWEKIPAAYQRLFDYVKASGWENRLAFEEEYDRDGVHYMDVYVPLNQ